MLIATLSAPFSKIYRACCSDLTPPPTVNGMSITSAIFLTSDFMVSRCSDEAVISIKTSSSAPSLEYFSANCTGSPASFIYSKFNPLTTRPFATSKHGIIRLVRTNFLCLLY